MRMTVLASGSKGNSTIVSSSTTRLLVDAGLSCRELLKRMQAAEEDAAQLDAILITHEHQDHVQGLAVMARRLGIPVFFTEQTHRAWKRWVTPQQRMTYADWLARRQAEKERNAAAPVPAMPQSVEELDNSDAHDPRDSWQRAADSDAAAPIQAAAIQPPAVESPAVHSEDLCEEINESTKFDPARLPAVEYFRSGSKFTVGDIEVTPFTIPHDAADPVGFVFEAEGIRMGIATDLGYMPPNVKMHLRRCDVLMVESNHDLEMLRDGPYPWSVKQRVMSRVGHLSNDALAEFLERDYDGGAAYVVLAHLSQNNNLPELARITAQRALADRLPLLCNRLVLAEQERPTPAIQL